MSAMADFTQDGADGGTLRFTGNLSLQRLGTLPQRLERVNGTVAHVDLSAVERIDTVGAWVVHRFAASHQASIAGLSPDGQHLLDQVVAADVPVEHRVTPPSPLVRVLGEVGDAVAVAMNTLLGLLGFLGATTLAFGAVIRHPSRFRFNAVVQRFEVVGVSALGIIGLMKIGRAHV